MPPLARILEKAGYVVLAASHGIEALRIVEEKEGRIDLLLTDVGLPRLRGPDVAQRLRDRLPKLKVLFMSGFGEDGLRTDEASRLAGRFLQKPFRKDTLLRKLEETLAER
jgi:two-component system cell cycle sensor histidine kinase/response regulator CckA